MGLLLMLAAAPSAAILLYVWKKDRIEKEPVGLLVKLFLLGMLSCLPAMLLESLGTAIFGDADGFVPPLLDAFIVVALVEEGCKLVLLRLGSWRHPAFNYRFDGLLYAVCVGVGFAALENILYVFDFGLGIAFTRALTAIPAHTTFAVCMGVFYAAARDAAHDGVPARSRRMMWLALIVPTLLHGFYDYCLMAGSSALSIIFFIFIVILDIIAIRLVRKKSRGDEPL